MKCIIGIDPSVNSTGVCVKRGNEYKYYIISSKLTKKMKSFSHERMKYLQYDKQSYTDLEYWQKEYIKTKNFYGIIECINDICKEHAPDMIIMEGISYGSFSGNSLSDLSGLNYMIRSYAIFNSIPFRIVAPSELKKFVCGNGQADKDIIIDSWKRIDERMNDINDMKIDDLADAFFLANYES